jgi:acyl dehydratase
MTERYLEDFAIGQAFGSGKIRIDKQRAKAFAAEFDPQPFHLDEEALRWREPRVKLAAGIPPTPLNVRFRK